MAVIFMTVVGVGLSSARPVSSGAPLSGAAVSPLPLAADVTHDKQLPLWTRSVDPPPPATPTPIPTAPPAAPRAHAAYSRVTANVPFSGTNHLFGPFGLNTAVTTYSDCSGKTALIRSEAAIDTCIPGRTYFVGHNPGVFTPIMSMQIGSIIRWYDSGGRLHTLRVVNVRNWTRNGMPPSPVGGATVQFQTCVTLDGSIDRIVDAAPV